MMQTELDFILDSKEVRDLSYKNIINDNHTSIQRDLVYKTILDHPEGITDIELSIITEIRLSSVNARRNELKHVSPVGIAIYTDEQGNVHLNTMWGIDDKGMDQ